MEFVGSIQNSLWKMQSKVPRLMAKGRSSVAVKARHKEQQDYDKLKEKVCKDLESLYFKIKITEQGKQGVPLNDDQRREAYQLRAHLDKILKDMQNNGVSLNEKLFEDKREILSSYYESFGATLVEQDTTESILAQESKDLTRRRTPWRPSTWQPLLLDRNADSVNALQCNLRGTDIELPDIPDFKSFQNSLLKPEDERFGEEIAYYPVEQVRTKQQRHDDHEQQREAMREQAKRRAERRAKEEAQTLEKDGPDEGNKRKNT